jgi:hypothetical protein
VSGASQNVTAARSQVDVLKAQEQLARVDLARTDALVKTGALPAQALDDARYCTLLAPRNAMVVTRNFEPGERGGPHPECGHAPSIRNACRGRDRRELAMSDARASRRVI